ncbi:phage tail protein X [Bradyrhizobium sp. GM7.3]
MTDTEKAPEEVVPAPIPRVKIVPDIPVFFADGVISHSYAPGISKFFFYRIDSDAFTTGPNQTVVVAQAVMAAEGFAKMVHFFNHRLQIMIRDGALSKEAAEAISSFDYNDQQNS